MVPYLPLHAALTKFDGLEYTRGCGKNLPLALAVSDDTRPEIFQNKMKTGTGKLSFVGVESGTRSRKEHGNQPDNIIYEKDTVTR